MAFLNQERLLPHCPAPVLGQCLETFLAVTFGGGGRENATGIEWVEARDGAKCYEMHRTAPAAENFQPEMPIMSIHEKPL